MGPSVLFFDIAGSVGGQTLEGDDRTHAVGANKDTATC